MKKALIVGINYVGTSHALRGCINDARSVEKLLRERFSFDSIELLLEQDATTAGILAALDRLVKGAVPGDVLFFHYSGHGSQVRSSIEPDGLDEIICPIDLNWRDKVIKDDDLKRIFGQVPNGVNITIILDCCHSGTGLDQDETLFSDKDLSYSDFVAAMSNSEEGESRYLPPPPEIMQEIKAEGLEIRDWVTSRDVNRSALLIAGCASNQTSADAFIDGMYQGAATCALIKAIEAGKVTYRDIVMFMADFMVNRGFSQRPQLDGHPSLYDQAFAAPWGHLFGTPTVVPPPGTWTGSQTQPVQAGQPEKKKENAAALGIIAIVVLLVLFILFSG